MAMNECPRCSRSFDEADGFFSAHGLVCATCHAQEEAADAARHREFDEAGVTDVAEPLSSRQTRTEVRADGTVVTHTTTTTLDAGPLNVVFGLVRRWFGRRDD